MSNWISVVVILGLIAVGFAVIHLLNGQHRDRIAAYSFARSLWNPQNRPAPGARAGTDTDTEADADAVSGGEAPPEQGERGPHGRRRQGDSHQDPPQGRHQRLSALSDLISGRARRRRKAAR